MSIRPNARPHSSASSPPNRRDVIVDNGALNEDELKMARLRLSNAPDGTLVVHAMEIDNGVVVTVDGRDNADPYIAVLARVTRILSAVRASLSEPHESTYIAALRDELR